MTPPWSKVIWIYIKAAAFHPSLWIIAAQTTFRMAKRGWWKKSPFLPLPGVAYWKFRMETVYGDPEALPSPADMRSFLQWAKS